jgi:hypothetical protein
VDVAKQRQTTKQAPAYVKPVSSSASRPIIICAGPQSLPLKASKPTRDAISLYQTLSVRGSRARTSAYPSRAHLSARSAFAKILFTSVTLLHPPIPTHLNLRTGAFFGKSDVEKEFHALPIEVHDRPLAMPHATGSVIMSKLGNETAKWAHFCFLGASRILT